METALFLKKEKLISCFFFALIFVFLFVFFTVVHPLVPYDGDDWTYLSYMRQAVPKWGAWNPTRVFAECFAPIIGFIAAFLVSPLIGDYIRSVTITTSIVMSAIITAYIWLFYRIVYHKSGSNYIGLQVAAVFFLFHFLVFKSKPDGNQYMFWTANYCCLYYYLIPSLMNCSLVLLLMDEGKLTSLFERLTPVKCGFLALWLYCAIFSSVFHSAIFMVYIGLYSLIDLYLTRPFDKQRFLEFIKEHRIEIAVLILWLIALVFEANGGRANSIGKSIWQLPFGETAKAGKVLLKSFSKVFLALSGVVLLGAIYQSWRMRKLKPDEAKSFYLHIGFAIVCGLLLCLYLFMLCSKASTGYFGRSDVIHGCIFYLFVSISISLAFVLKNCDECIKVLPVFTFVVFIASLNSNHGLRESTMWNIPPAVCYEVDYDLMNQIIEADRAGVKEMTLVVPRGDNRDNWPHPNYMGARIWQTMYRHSLIHRQFKIKIKPDVNMNKKYNLPILK